LFEVTKTDLAARIGRIKTNHGTVETPAYVPVIHPVKQSIPARKIREMGFDVVITNAYISRNSYGDEAARRGIHKIIGYDGAVMTDSGGYQVLEYGDVDVSPVQMREFQTGIMSDFAIPLDRPTGFGLPKARAKKYVDHTLKVCRETLEASPDNGQIWMGPIQGGEHSELVRRSTRGLLDSGFRMLALGSPVEFMESYEYRLLAEMIIAAKRHVPHSVPLHLFGAGHPLTIPFAVALGCDTFDSASYMLYAKQDRYITEDRTRHLSEMTYFSCPCEVCAGYTPRELYASEEKERTNRVALHNLYAIRSEVGRVKEAITEGRLWEHVMKKCRAHPRLYEVIGVMTQNSGHLQKTTPKFKERAMFLYSAEDQFRPEVASYNESVRRYRTKKRSLVIMPETARKPAYLSPEYGRLKKAISDIGRRQVCQYNPFLGLVPLEISDLYPASHYVAVRTGQDPREFPAFEETWMRFFENNRFEEITYDKDDEFLRYFVRKIPNRISKKSLRF